jgi:hypothetical protein
MRAPSDRHTDKEIIEAIVKEAGGRSVEPPVDPLIKRRIADLRELFSPFTGNRRDNREYLSDLIKDFDKLKKKLKHAPWPLSAALSMPEMFNSLVARQHTGIGINPQTRLIAQRMPGRLTGFLADLDLWRGRCDQLRTLGTHKNLDYLKLGCAIAARELLEHIAAMAGKELSLSGRRTSKFVVIAALFYEAITEMHNADLRWACDRVAAPVRGKR